jgi:hypothetical protein
MKQWYKFALEDYSNFTEDKNAEIAVMDCCFLSTKPNTHKLDISEQVLKECASTILGKWIIGNMDWLRSDFLAHEKKPEIYGYIPDNQEVRFVRKDGYLLAYVKAILSKIYATDAYNAFKANNVKNVSVEMLTELDEDNKVKSFNICGLTLLGRKGNKEIKGSCPDAKAIMIQFSEQANNYFNSTLSNIEKLQNLRKYNERKTKVMSDIKLEDESVVMEKEQLSDDKEKLNDKHECLAEDKDKVEDKDVEDKDVKDEKDKDKQDEKEESDKADEKDKDKDVDDKKDDKMSEEEFESKLADKDKELQAKCEELTKCQEELETLRKFKADIEEKQKLDVVDSVLARVKGHVTEQQFAQFEASSKEYTFSNITSWKNEILAKLADTLLDNNESHLRMKLEEVETNGSLWDRL